MKMLFENWRKFLLKEAAKSVHDLAKLDYGDTSKGPPDWMLNLIQSKGIEKAAEMYKVPLPPTPGPLPPKGSKEHGKIVSDIANMAMKKEQPPKSIVIIIDTKKGFAISYGAAIFDGEKIRIEFFHSTDRKGSDMTKGDAITGFPAGSIEVIKAKPEFGDCEDGYISKMTYNTTKGWGPLLYDVAMEYATSKGSGLMSDRDMVSSEAKGVWDYYLNKRSDVEPHQLDIDYDEARRYDLAQRTPRNPKDDCEQLSSISWGMGPEYGAWEKDGWQSFSSKDVKKDLPWAKQSLSKMYTKDGHNIEFLKQNNLIHAPGLGLDLSTILLKKYKGTET